jgi:hypothetical protein
MNDWALVLFDRRVSPIQVAVMSAFDWIGEPFSPSQFFAMYDEDAPTLTNVSYHMRALENFGLLRVVDTRMVRGAVEVTYWPTLAPLQVP